MPIYEMPFDKLSFMDDEKGNVCVIAEFVNDRPFSTELKKIEVWEILQKMATFIFNVNCELFSKGDKKPIVVYENLTKTFCMKYDGKLFYITIHTPKSYHTFSYNQRQIADLIKFLL